MKQKVLSFGIIFMLTMIVATITNENVVKAQSVYFLGPGMYWSGVVADSLVGNAVQASFVPTNQVVGFVIQYGSDVGVGTDPGISTAWGWEAPNRITNEVTSTGALLGQTTCTGYGGYGNYVQDFVCPQLAPGAYQNLAVPGWEPVPPGFTTWFGGKCVLENGVGQYIDCTFSGTIYPIYYGTPPTPTPVPTVHTPTPNPCDFVPFDNGYVWDINYNYNIWAPPPGSEEVQVYFDDETVLVFADETIVVPAATWTTIDKPVGGFSCFALPGVCDAGQYQARPTSCVGIGGNTPMPEFDGSENVEWGVISYNCAISVSYDTFDLTAIPILSTLQTLGLSIPAIGWVAGTWQVCFEQWGFTKLEIGTIDFYYDYILIMGLLSLVIIGFFIRR